MFLRAFSLLDTKSGIHGVPFFCPHEQIALRMVAELAQDKSTTVGRYPSDFVVVAVGEFDDNAGVLGGGAPRTLINVASLLAQRELSSAAAVSVDELRGAFKSEG